MMRALAAALLLTGCATTPPSWLRVDGGTVTDRQFEADQTVCRGEMQKSRLSNAGNALLPGLAVADVYVGCMAQRGYIQQAPDCRRGISDTRFELLPCKETK